MFAQLLLVATVLAGGAALPEGWDRLDFNKSANIETTNRVFRGALRDMRTDAWPLAEYMSTLNRRIAWRTGRLFRVILSQPATNDQAYMYVIKNDDALSKSTGRIPDELLALAGPELGGQLKAVWRDTDPANIRLTKLYEKNCAALGGAIKKDMNAVRDYDKCGGLKLDKFSFYDGLIENIFRYHPLSQFGYSYEDVQEFRKTVVYLIRDKSPLQALALTYLYIVSQFRYSFNSKLDLVLTMVRDKQLDCMDAAYLYHAVLSTAGGRPELYTYFLKEKNAKHAFGSVKIDDYYYFYDEVYVLRHKDFMGGLNAFFPEPKYGVRQIQKMDIVAVINLKGPDEIKHTDFIDFAEARRIAPK